MVDIMGGAQKPSLFTQLKNFDFSGALETITSYDYNWIEIGACVGIGFLSGFLFKKYFSTFIMCVVFGAVVLGLLDYANLIQIDLVSLQSTLGLQQNPQQMTTLFQSALEWIKLNLTVVSCFGVGFIVGFKVG